MDAQQRTRSCNRQPRTCHQGTPHGSKQICIPMTRDIYDRIWDNAREVRRFLTPLIQTMPELFPPGMKDGYQFSGRLPESKKMSGIRLRQVRVQDDVYTLRPSFVMGYMTGTVSEVEHPLLLLSFGVPCWVVTTIFGRNDMYWERHVERLGRNSLVGTTVPDPVRLPQHLAGDEHHVDWCGQKGYVAVTAGGGCLLGVALTEGADEEHLRQAYGEFAMEARAVKPDYSPQTVNTDGWFATQNAFQALFAPIAVILCFLHGFLKIRDRCRRGYELHQRIWDVYRADTAVEFHQRMADFRSWFEQGSWSSAVREMVAKLWKRASEYAVAYEHPGCHRTSNQVDRLMNRMTRLMYAGRGLRGHQQSSTARLRGWALLHNFRHFAPRSGHSRDHSCPAHRLSGKQYHPHWLHNLQVSASLAGHRPRT